MKRILIVFILMLLPSIASAQCNGIFSSGKACGNPGATSAPPKPASVSALTAGFKDPAQLATTANISLTGEQTIDGTLTSASRILVKDQTNASQNGCYVTSASAWSRCVDMNAAGQLSQGTKIYVANGFTNAYSTFVLLTANPITVGSTALQFGSTRRTLYAEEFGVVPSLSIDNTTAMQAALTACENAGEPSGFTGNTLILPPGLIVINGTLSATEPCDVVGSGGSGGGFSDVDYGGTVIQQNTVSANVFDFSALNGVSVRDLSIFFNGGVGSGTGIYIHSKSTSNPNRFSRIENVRIWGGGYGIYCNLCANYSFLHNFIRDFATDGIYAASTSAAPDEGDGLIIGNTIWDFNVTTGTAGIQFNPQAATVITGNKILGASYGVYLTASQGPTGTLIVSDNSIEQQTLQGIRIEQSTAGKTFYFIDIHDNEIQNSLVTTWEFGIEVAAGTAQYIHQIQIHDNIIVSSGTTYSPAGCIDIGDGKLVSVHHNSCDLGGAASSNAYSVSGNATNVSVSENAAINFGNLKYAFSVPVTLIDHWGVIFSSVNPTYLADGSQFFITDGAPGSSPCTGSSSGSMAFAQGGALKCF